MFWKLVLGSILLAAIVDCKKDRCEMVGEQMDNCLKNGYRYKYCPRGEREMTNKEIKKCRKVGKKIWKNCLDYKCESGSTGSGK